LGVTKFTRFHLRMFRNRFLLCKVLLLLIFSPQLWSLAHHQHLFKSNHKRTRVLIYNMQKLIPMRTQGFKFRRINLHKHLRFQLRRHKLAKTYKVIWNYGLESGNTTNRPLQKDSRKYSQENSSKLGKNKSSESRIIQPVQGVILLQLPIESVILECLSSWFYLVGHASSGVAYGFLSRQNWLAQL